LTSASLNISNSTGLGLTITGLGTSSTLVSGGSAFQVFSVSATTTGAVTISNLTIENGNAAVAGGGPDNAGNLTLSAVTVQNNTSAGAGGGIANELTGQLTANNVTVTGNFVTTANGGGGIANGGGNVNASGLIITLNATSGDGGGIASSGTFTGTGTGTGLDVEHNTANSGTGNGGGVENVNGTLSLGTSTIPGGTIAFNSAAEGGGIANLNSSVHNLTTLDGVVISNNTAAASDGGGIANNGPLTMGFGSSINANSANSLGGGLYNTFNLGGVGPNLSGVTINGNNGTSGGGIYDDTAGGGLTMPGGLISGNTATTGNGGGVAIDPTGPTTEDTFSGVSITLNPAFSNGGGIYQSAGAGGLLLNNGTSVTNNSATHGNAGGIYLDSNSGPTCSSAISPSPTPPLPIPASNVCISGGTITGNSAVGGGSNGGGIFNTGANLLVNASSVSNNSASTQGGGIFSPVGAATIVSSSISNNQIVAGSGSQLGAGFYGGNASPVDAIYYSTISGNAVVATAPGDGSGAGIYNAGGLSMVDDTVANNLGAFDGAGIYNTSPLALKNVTISGNSTAQATGSMGGGIFNSGGTVNLIGTILANDQAGLPLTPKECANSPVVSNGYNEDIGSTCGFTTANHDLSSSNPLLGPLANNGGPTQTEALSAGSPAIGVIPGALPGRSPSPPGPPPSAPPAPWWAEWVVAPPPTPRRAPTPSLVATPRPRARASPAPRGLPP
jgi:hypothetical protein